MMTRLFMPALAALALAVVGCQAAVPLTDEDLAAIADVRQAYADAVLAGDAAAVAALYTEEAVEMPPNLPATEGRAAIQARYEALGEAVTDFTITGEAEGQGTLAYDRGTFSATMALEGAPEPYTDEGKYLAVCEKQADGSWLMKVAVWNSDLPLPEPEPSDTT
jgi:ketosteroid isomerase-like protein